MRTWIAAGLLLAAPAVFAAEGTSIFNGTDFAGWMNAGGGAPGTGWVVQAGAMVLQTPKSGGDIWTKDRFGDFVLALEFKTTGNSGIFIRTDNPKDNVQSGIEVQVITPGAVDRHSVGALYDLVAPAKTNAKGDDWNKVVITAQGAELKVEMNGEVVNGMNLDQWITPGQNPDGSKNKFKAALKDFKRDGHIGFQDHGSSVQYRNITIRPLK